MEEGSNVIVFIVVVHAVTFGVAVVVLFVDARVVQSTLIRRWLHVSVTRAAGKTSQTLNEHTVEKAPEAGRRRLGDGGLAVDTSSSRPLRCRIIQQDWFRYNCGSLVGNRVKIEVVLRLGALLPDA